MAIEAGHIAPQAGGFEPQRAYDFEVELYGVAGSTAIRLSIQSMAMPIPTVGQIEVHFGPREGKWLGR